MDSENELRIEAGGEKTFGPCNCCGKMTKRIWGFVYEHEAALAAYFVEWTPGHPCSSANFDLIIGTWGNDADNATRRQSVWSSAELKLAQPSWSSMRLLGVLRVAH